MYAKIVLLLSLVVFSSYGHAKWSLTSNNRIYCELTKVVDSAEFKIFSRSGKNKIEGLLKTEEKRFKSDFLSVIYRAPLYSGRSESGFLYSKKLYTGFDVEFQEKEVFKIINELLKNNYVELKYIVGYSGEREVGLIEKYNFRDFNEAYKKFIDCHSKLFSFGFGDIKRTYFNYEINKRYPVGNYKGEIKKIADYLKESDILVNEIEINVYTDKIGSRENNKQIALIRGEFIKELFEKEGLNDKTYTIISNGEKRNIDGNQSSDDRFRNRRTIIIIK